MITRPITSEEKKKENNVSECGCVFSVVTRGKLALKVLKVLHSYKNSWSSINSFRKKYKIHKEHEQEIRG